MKKLFASLLCVCMVLSLLPLSAFAESTAEISTPEQLAEAITKGGSYVLTQDIDMSGKTANPPDAGQITLSIDGAGHTISNWSTSKQGLFVHHTGSTKYAFRNITLSRCSVDSATNYAALFVGDADTSDEVVIENCHVENCTVVSAKYAAAFIAYTAGYNRQGDGPVYSDISIKDCSVSGGSVTGRGSVGAAIGHSGGNPDTTNIISDLSLENVSINGEDARHTGIVVGTAHVGKTLISDVTVGEGVTGNYNSEHTLYGRFVFDATGGTLVVDGTAVEGSNAVAMVGTTLYSSLEAAVAAAAEGDEVIILKADTYKLPNLPRNITVKGTDGVIINAEGSGSIASVPKGATFENLVFFFGASSYHGFQHAGDITMNGCTLNGLFFSYGNMAFNGCTFNAPGTQASGVSGTDYSMWAYGRDLTFTDCVFNCAGKCINVYCENNSVPYVITANGCEFHSTASRKAAFNVKETCGNNVLQYQLNITDCTADGSFPTPTENGVLKVLDPLLQVDDRILDGTEKGGEIRISLNNSEIYRTPKTRTVAKIGDTEYRTLAAALAAVPTDGTQTTVTMIDDETIPGNAGAEVKKGQNVVLDLNGFTVKNSVNENKASQVIKNSGTLTVCDRSAEGTGLLTNDVAPGTQAGEWWGTTQYNYATNVILNCGTLTVDSGEIFETAAGSICYAIDNNSSAADAILNVNGGYIHKESGTAVRMFCNSTTYANTLNMTDGDIEAGYSALWIQLPGQGQKKLAALNVSGGTMKGNFAFYDFTYGDVFDEVQYTISGGAFDGAVYTYGANITVSGGTFRDDIAVNQLLSAKIAVTGGRFDGDIYSGDDNAQGDFISGGLFALDPNKTFDDYSIDYDLFVASGLRVIANTDPETMEQYPYTVGEAAASIGDTNYSTLQEAIDAAEDGDVVEVLSAGQKAFVKRSLTFTLRGQGADSAEIDAGEGFVKTEGKDGTVVIAEKPDDSLTPVGPVGPYPVEVSEDTVNGTVLPNVKSASSGEKVTFTVTPAAGYQTGRVSVTDKDGREIPVTENKDGSYSFKMPAGKAVISASFQKVSASFEDVLPDSYFYEPVMWAYEKGITTGKDSAHFAPFSICTRAEVVTFLWRASGSPEPKTAECPFTDVVPGSFYEKAVLWAFENGITKGTSDTEFSPSLIITRSQAVTFLYRMSGDTEQGTVNPFTDVQEGAFYYDAVLWAYAKGITEGTSASTFAPAATCQRAQIVTFLYRFFTK